MRYLYSARLVPIGQPVKIPDDHGRLAEYTFSEQSFALEAKTPSRINVCLQHDRAKVVGNLAALIAHRGWWLCDFMLDRALSSELKVGQPVSVGLGILAVGSGRPILSEVSIVPRPAVDGARVTGRHELKPSAPPKPPAAARTSTATVPPGEVLYGGGVIHRSHNHKADAEMDELNRRLDWAERHHGHADFEQILTNLRIELGYERRLHVSTWPMLGVR